MHVHVACNGAGNPRGGGSHGIPRRVGVACGRLELTVAEELSDRRLAFSGR